MPTRAQPEISNERPGSASFPPGLANAFIFATFNALSFQIVLGSPMVLYAKSLEASATVLGIIAGMMPLLVIFQIPAAAHIARVGYKRFFYAGWGTRVMFIFGMALVPLSGGFLGNVTQLALILSLLFGFNLSRGISSAAWLPWITTLVPIEIRGKYLAREATCVQTASCVAMMLSALCLGHQSRAWQFAALFGLIGIAGQISIGLFLEPRIVTAYALVIMNNTRLTMVLTQVMGRSHFFALYSVVANLALGLAPVLWGLVIDAFGARQFRWHHAELNRFSLL